MSSPDERKLTISGVKVVFPCKPYPSQFGMMDRVIKGLERKQNSLLESPTGSGKSLALLCSALAWQVAQNEKITKENMNAESVGCSKPCQCHASDAGRSTEYSPESKPGYTSKAEGGKVIDVGDEEVNGKGDDDNDDDDFKPSAKIRTPILGQGKGKKRRHLGIQYEDEPDCCTDNPNVKCTCNTSGPTEAMKKQKLPKIYFGTRTHKQIAQITRELKKTAYHDARMVILASREYTCIHPEVTIQKNKSEGCRERLDIHGQGCKFNDKSKRVFLSQRQLQDELPTAWDLEDLVSSCTKKKACPYFVTRNLKEGADIIFCPYNYLIDPLVRKSMDITLKDQIVILDEAHNIEDCARDAASGSVTTDQITQSILNLQQLMEHNIKYVEHLKLRNMLESLLNFIEGNNSNLDQSDYDTSYKVWSGFDIVVRLKGIGLGPDSFQEYQRCFEQAVAQNDDEAMAVRDRRNKEVKMSSNTQKILEQLFQILDYMYRDDLKFVEDYRTIISNCSMVSRQGHSKFYTLVEAGDRWLGKNRRGGSRIVVFTLNFWCMNPAVAFSDFSSCRNVVLSSGTLSPMSSFASELGTPFPIQLEANHIIEDKQVFVGAVGVGPSGNQLQAVYRNMETFAFQDELGNLIHQVCTKVPHGVLCFLPSYRALDKFIDRWKLTGLWNKLSTCKRVMVEPRAADREDFDGMMKAFYEVVKGDLYNPYLDEAECNDDDSEIDGALFFAVCRGKVSEGMDFADDNARAVITVGIPYPSFKDVQVKLKREYNDKHKIDRGLLSGGDWYEIQAFRALNQALGRCIRHRKDWGALIIVDDRFVKRTEKYCKSLSRWVRSKVQTFDVFSDFLTSMSNFTEKMIKEMPKVSPDTSFIPSTPCDDRRDSVYKRHSLDNSYLNSTIQASPYFTISNQQMPAQMPSMVPPIVPLTQAAGQQVVLNMPGTNQHQTILLTMPQLPVQGTNLPQSAAIPGTSLKSDFRGGNQLDKTNSTDGIKAENVSKAEKKADIVFTLGSSTLSAEEQLKKFVSSSQAPRNQAYYVVVNKGETDERAFFIEPNKKGKSKPNTEKKIEAEKTDDSLVKTLDPVKTEQDKKPVKVEQEVVVPDSSTGDPEPQNKFLKFCQLPKTPAKVPVAAVTPQRQSEQEIKTETVDSVKEEPGSLPQTMSKTSHNPQTTSTSRQLQPTCTSPVLFEDGQTDGPAPDCVDKTNNLADLDKEHSTKKKPIFKKRNSLSTKTLKSEIEDCKGTSKDGDSNIDEVNNDKDNADDFKDESKGGRRIKSTTRGKVDLSVVDKVKQGRKKSDDVLQEAKDKNVGEELLDGESASGNDVNSDEEFLNTRRRGGRKRKSTSKFQEWSKRSRKGVTYEDNENTDEKENKARNQFLSCIKCGNKLLPLGQYEKQKKHPEFLTCVFKKNTELIYFPNMKNKDCQLQTVETETNHKGN
ncbi:Fanconi anemia group J protein homolog [Ruditapes philippinarum]|uniref:Fanconi anemia group J protein homolog n=1 Tax=Ruditapes philippinarum TaxID=129788 RepID=UPI00295C2D55|nr:Fanconi anemia group J protein homolog [Ruditapes philippinarum]